MIGKKIRQAREAKNLSAEHVAAQLKISLPAYLSLEEGENTPTPERTAKLAQLLGHLQAYASVGAGYQCYHTLNIRCGTGTGLSKTKQKLTITNEIHGWYLFQPTTAYL